MMKRSRTHFESSSNGDPSAASPQGAFPPNNGSEDDSRQPGRYIPKISRRIRACTECKRHKVRCDMKAGEAVCHRCRRMNLDCVVNKSLQTLLEDEADWKSMIELAVADLLRKAELPELSYYQSCDGTPETLSKKGDRKESTVSTEELATALMSSRANLAMGSASGAAGYGYQRQQPQYLIEREDGGASSLVTAPMGSLYEVTQLEHFRKDSPSRQDAPDQTLGADFISRGVVALQEAEELFQHFDQVLNRYLWDGILLVHKDLVSVRKSSSMLSAAILAVTALHMPTKERIYDTCYVEFARLASESMLGHRHSLDDLRALCIGAFWLADVSWKLSGYAVRIATERNVHQSYRKAAQGSPEHIEQVRLWYLLYVLEHHFSIAYGRPPIIHEDPTITNHNTLTLSPTVSQPDLRLHCQVDLFIVLTRIYHAFGPDVDLEVPESDFPTLDRFDADIRGWETTWSPRLIGSRHVGAYPIKAIWLHSHFSRLQLNSVALRTYHSSSSARVMSPERKKRANIAIDSAIATLQVVLDEPDIQRALVGVPLYLHSMITFAAVFLLKIAVKTGPPGQLNSIASAGLLIDPNHVRNLVARVVELMVSCSQRAGERHLSHHIARGLGKMLAGLEEWDKRCTQQHQQQQQQQPQQQQKQQPSGHHAAHTPLPSLFKPAVISSSQSRAEHDTILSHPPPLIGVAPLSAERNTGFGLTMPQEKHQPGLSEGSADPMMADLWGFDEEYFPTGVFDFLQSQMPA